jgi:hypothetical protein
MNWKQFLKPDRRKIIITIIIFLLVIVYWFYGSWGFIECGLWPGGSESGSLCEPSYSLPWESCSFHCGKPDAIISIMIEIYPILLIIWNLASISIIPYLLSCIISWLYDSYRKPRKKQK